MAEAAPGPQAFLPARWPPLLYAGLAHASLATALAIAAADPRGVMGFYYGPRLVSLVHLVTLGWITSWILGSFYVVGPLAFRVSLPAGPWDYAAFAAFAVGVSGMASHFALDRLPGMVWSAGLVALALLFVGGRMLLGLTTAPVPGHGRLAISLAILNVWGAAGIGLLLGVNKTDPLLPASHFAIVLGHAHLAVLGWALLMVMGAGYRLFPMILPAAMPSGLWPYASVILVETGAWGLFFALSAWERAAFPFACAAVGGIAVFLGQVVWMARHRRPAPAERRYPDVSLAHVVQALGYLGVSAGLGCLLAFRAPSEWTTRVGSLYGVAALLGFLGHVIVGVGGRLLPLYGWLWGFADRRYEETPPSLHHSPPRRLQMGVLLLWSTGVPVLAAGLFLGRAPWVTVAAAGLSAAAVVGGLGHAFTLVRLWRR